MDAVITIESDLNAIVKEVGSNRLHLNLLSKIILKFNRV